MYICMILQKLLSFEPETCLCEPGVYVASQGVS